MSYYWRKPAQPPMKFFAAKPAHLQRPVHPLFAFQFLAGLAIMLTLSAGVALFAVPANAQPADAPPADKYSAKDLERAFNFMDANQDGKISREEAASFRNVAKYFDQADTDKDQMLSREEFENAMNQSKAKAP
jgi:biopolymer transport protein ExbB/TolQ